MSSSEVNKVQQRVKYVINSPAYCSTATRHGMWGAVIEENQNNN